MKVHRSSLLILAVHLNILLFGQPINRLVILADGDLANPEIQAQIATLHSDFNQYFGVTDVNVLSVLRGPLQPREKRDFEELFQTAKEALLRLQQLCNNPVFSVVIAFIFPVDEGPGIEEVAETLDKCNGVIRLYSNEYYKKSLSDFTCTRYKVFDYAKGSVRSRDTIITEEHHFPIIPVLGGTALVGTGIILLTGDGGKDCNPADLSWQIPAGLCDDDAPVVLSVTGTTGGTWSGTGVNANGTFSPSAGTQAITYTVGEGDCRVSRTQTIEVVSVNASWNLPAQPCAGQTVILVPLVIGGTWSGAGIVQNPNGTANFTRESAGSYEVTYRLTIGACSDEQSQMITVLPDADPGWTIPETPCAGESIDLIPAGTPGGQWTGEGVIDHGDGSGTFSSSTAGAFNVTYQVGVGECSGALSQIIEVLPVPDASWSPPSAPLCVNEEVALLPTGTAGGTWSGMGITDHGNGTATFVQNSTGTYTVTYLVTLGMCSASYTQDVMVIDKADPAWISPGEICSGTSHTLIPTGTTGGAWTGQGVTDQGNGTATFASNESGSFDITYTVGSGACQTELTQQINVIQTPNASWSVPGASLCVNETITLIPTGDPGGTWSGNGITDLGNGTASFTQSTPGTYAVTYMVTSGICSASLAQDITVIAIGDPLWTSPGDICTGEILTLMPSGTPGGAWTGEGITDNGDGTATFLSTEAGTYAITYMVGTGTCAAALTMDIVVFLDPDPSWTAPQNALCAGDVFMLVSAGTQGGTWAGEGVTDHGDGTADFTNTNTGAFDVTHTVINGPCSSMSTQTITVVSQPDATWNPPDDVCTGAEITLIPTGTQGGTWSGTGVTDLGDGTAVFSASEVGTYNITYTIGQGICESSLTLPIDVMSLPDATWSPPTDVCQGQSVILTPDGTQGGIWTGEGVTDLGNGTAQFMQDNQGSYEVTYAVSTGPCISSVSHTIEVFPLGDPSWTVPSDVCAGQEILLVPEGTQGGEWSGPGVTDLGNGTAQFLQNSDGTYPVTYLVGQGECTQALTQDIVVDASGDPAWSPPSDVICQGAVVDLVATEGTWSGDGVTDLGGGSGEFQAFESGIYTITHTVGSGNCVASESHDVEVGDFDPPVIEIPASDMFVTCDGGGNITELQDWLDSSGGAEASDNCQGTITWEHDFTDFQFDCGMTGTAFVIFTASDEAGNTATTIGVFTIEDFDPPVFEAVPPDIIVPCNAIPPPDPVIAIDVCSGDADVILEELPPGTDCPYEIIRIWTSTDACGNEATAQQTILAFDDQPPEPLILPHDTFINCSGPPEQCIPPPDPVEFVDNCDSQPSVTLMEEIQLIPDGLLVIRCWTATDDCGNMSPPVCHNIIIISGEPEGEQFQPQILLSLNSLSSSASGQQVETVFTPGNVHWEDPGLNITLPDAITRTSAITHMLPLSLEIEIPLESGIHFYAGSSLRKALLRRNYSDTEQMIFSGSLRQQSYHAGLRFIPESSKHISFFSGLRYLRNTMTDFRFMTKNRNVYSDETIHTFSVAPVFGIEAHFTLGNIGSWKIKADYGTQDDGSIVGALQVNITSLVQAFRNQRK